MKNVWKRIPKFWQWIGFRLFLLNAVMVLAPVAGLEFAELYEKSFLYTLEQDMRNQAVLLRHFMEQTWTEHQTFQHQEIEERLQNISQQNLLWIRILDTQGQVLLDSSKGYLKMLTLEPPPDSDASAVSISSAAPQSNNKPWPAVAKRQEVKSALKGLRGAMTRKMADPPALFLLLTEPIVVDKKIRGVVYVSKTTQSVLLSLYQVRSGLYQWVALAFGLMLLATAWLSFSISRPLSHLSRTAKTITAGNMNTKVPVEGTGQIRTLAESFSTMTQKLQTQVAYTADYAANVAHEFKSPLTSIRGAAELLREGAAEDPHARETFLGNIEKDADRLNLLVSRLLELSRIEASTEAKEVIDLHTLLTELSKRMSSPDNDIVLHDESVVPPVFGRRADLETAFINLLDNALRYSPPGASVDVHLTCQDEQAVVTIRDYGPGIHASYMGKLFGRFLPRQKDEGGTGLGLSIVQSVVSAHRGTVDADNATEGQGSVFRVTLPL